MEADLFTLTKQGVINDITTEYQKTSNKQNGNNPKKIFFWFFLLLSISVGVHYIVDSITEPKPNVILSDEAKLEELIKEVVDGSPLADVEWEELCQLLSSVKGIDIKACGECKDYITALLGGRHAQWLREYLDIQEKSILKGIKKLERQIAEHLDKIKNPKKHYPNWDNLDPRRKNNLTNYKWKKDIERQQEQKKILECILKNK